MIGIMIALFLAAIFLSVIEAQNENVAGSRYSSALAVHWMRAAKPPHSTLSVLVEFPIQGAKHVMYSVSVTFSPVREGIS